MLQKIRLLVISSVLLCSGAWAQDARIGASFGSLGLSAYYSTPVSERWETKIGYIRGPGFGDKVSLSVDSATTNTVNLFRGLSLIGDFYPVYGSGFRLSLGAYFNKPTSTTTIVPFDGQTSLTIEGVTLNNIDASGDRTITSTTKLSNSAAVPYVGMGYTGVVSSSDGGLRFNFDLGLLFYNPEVDVDFGSAYDQTSQQSAMREINNRILNAFEKKKYLPVVSIGLDYAF